MDWFKCSLSKKQINGNGIVSIGFVMCNFKKKLHI